jgi:starch synthase
MAEKTKSVATDEKIKDTVVSSEETMEENKATKTAGSTGTKKQATAASEKKTSPAKKTTVKKVSNKATEENVEVQDKTDQDKDKIEEKKTTTRRKTTKTATKEADEAKAEKKTTTRKTTKKATTTTRKKTTEKEEPEKEGSVKKVTEKKEEPKEESGQKKTAAKKKDTEEKSTKKSTTRRKTTEKKEEKKVSASDEKEKKESEEEAVKSAAPENPEIVGQEEQKMEEKVEEPIYRKKVLFVGSECYPFVKTGGLGDVMYALPKALNKVGCDARVILPKYRCIPWEYQEKMEYIHNFYMDLRRDGKNYYVGVFKYEMDGVTYYFIDNEELFSEGNPYTSIPNDVVKFTYFCKAALAVLPIVDFIPDIIHCHDWQASLVPIYLRTLFSNTETCRRAQTIMTIHNLKFQGVCNLETLRFWSGLPDDVFTDGVLKDGIDANMLKGGLTYANKISTVSNTYAGEIKTATYGEHLDQHIGYHHMKLCGIVNGIDYDMYNPTTDSYIYENYSIKDVIEKKKKNKRALQEELGLEQDTGKFVVGIISRLTDQKGLDLINFIMNALVDPYTQVAVLGTGDPRYEESFRYYENHFKGRVCSNIMYSEERAHKIYAGADALLVPSQFEPCGLTQLIAMHYGTVPIVRETGGLKDTVQAYNEYEETGNGFSFYEYNANQLLNIVNYAKTVYFTRRESWDAMVKRDMEQDVSWARSATQYKALYDSMLGW